MCRNIRTLFNFEPPATKEEVHDAALQFVRKISGFTMPSSANEKAFNKAVDDVAKVSNKLLNSLVTRSKAKDRQIEAMRKKTKAAKRFESGR